MRARKRLTVTIGILFLVLVPFVSRGLTLEEIAGQARSLLERVAALQVKLKEAEVKESEASGFVNLPCLSLSRSLSIGSKGEDVKYLQGFLIRSGMLETGNDTGYFGILTEGAVKKWQSARGIVSSGDRYSTGFGIVGPKTRAAILTNCPKFNAPKPESRVCPAEGAVPPASECGGTWEKGYDANGCLTGYQCSVPTAATPPPTPAPRPPPVVTVLSPRADDGVVGGSTLRITWQTENASTNIRVSLSLVSESGEKLGRIAENLYPSGTYVWRVPKETKGCLGGTAFDCIEQLAQCESSGSLCAIPTGRYAVLAELGNGTVTSSPLFRVAGSAITIGLADTLTAATTGTSSLGSLASLGSGSGGRCLYAGAAYPDGATLSVPCALGQCPSSSSGYVTAKCTTVGLWCVPETSYCATTIDSIDLSAYEGAGGTTVRSGYSIGCPAEGYRAYLSCSGGGCTSGWNTCRGGIWILDPPTLATTTATSTP